MPNASKPKVLFLPAWYPNRYDHMSGSFVPDHARAVAPHADVAVLAIVQHPDVKKTETDIQTENGILTFRVYTPSSHLPGMGRLFNFRNYLITAERAYKQIERLWGRPQLTHVHVLTRPAILASDLEQKHRIPYIISEHWSRYLPQNAGSYRGYWRKRYTREIVAGAACVCPVSEVMMQAMKAHKLNNPWYEVVPNPIDTGRFKPGSVPKQNGTSFINVSCFDEKAKNLTGVLQAARLLADDGYHNFKLVMVGDGKDRQMIEQEARQLKLGAQCVFTGLLEGEALVNEYQKSDALILFSKYETFGLVIPEALSCGIPVISTPVGVAPQLINPQNGILLADHSPAELAQAMARFFHKPLKPDAAGLHRQMQEQFSYEAVGRKLSAIYQKVLSA